ncbi:hypothetical protein IWW34DRAFT_749764 [Fusarium oxysporum f. sp. albedinis]|uniref:Uncharacterized protein n=2 Tax=Fusarium oxysporum TaxID=5507 RepID=A0A4Q2W2B6_FUSOX|nr:hypothetical protein IWW34DRAFT_749764 [Fusarium oxysporum f. sp. albedinis]RKK18288.1 hypothetical protein BFJ65_g8599 [Fusarium oxysporum f. sp. cepae]RKL13151.1 hypothetical protein BFJ70_g16012 [Fusarium oxysporum]RYC93244.1 hypothetical protein BFJ63_vAg3841 [Fusarium oxysporum f. sp. narcissi]KAJ0152341.1 hypothetical protein HZ326_5275 [Fusarium oxysporum f. sp. albedinis]
MDAAIKVDGHEPASPPIMKEFMNIAKRTDDTKVISHLESAHETWREKYQAICPNHPVKKAKFNKRELNKWLSS